jgi:nitroreductase
MQPISGKQIQNQLQWRYATKKFDSTRKISAADWAVLEQVLVLTPSSFGLQPWKFFVVTSPQLKAQLPAASWGQKQPEECSHMVVLAARHPTEERDLDRFIQRTAEVRGLTTDSLAGFRKMLAGSLASGGIGSLDWAGRQVYIALGQFMACAAMMGIDTCPMEGINPAKYDEILGIREEGYTTCVGCAAGYRAVDDKYAELAKVRYDVAEVITHR